METAVSSGQAAIEPSLLPIAREGLVGGVIGASAVAVWFLIVDIIAGQPFHTPALLGARIFQGATAEQLAGMPESAAALVAGYTLVHGLSFVIAGLILAGAAEVFERTPPLLIPGFFFLVVFFEFVYYMYVLAFLEPVLGTVNWPEVLLGNLLAIVSMATYFWRRHPDLLGKLARG